MCIKITWEFCKMQILVTKILSYVSSRRVMALGFTFKSIIHFVFIFVCVWGMDQSSFFKYVDIQLFQHHLLKKESFLHRTAFAPLSKINWPYMCVGLFLDSLPVPLIYLSWPRFLTWSWRLMIQKQNYSVQRKDLEYSRPPWCLPVFSFSCYIASIQVLGKYTSWSLVSPFN